MNESDEVIYERFLKMHRGDDFRILLERHREKLILFINGYINDLTQAEDIMLDAFAETAAGRTVFHGRSSYKTWLFSIAKNLSFMYLRKKRNHADIQDYDIESGDLPELDILKEERNYILYKALEKLNPDYRQILMLLYFEDMSHEDAGRVMNKNRKQIYHLAERGRKALKEVLEGLNFEYDV